MPDLDQVLAPPPRSPGNSQVLEGELVLRDSGRWARVDDSDALWGPLVGGAGLDAGTTVVLAITQTGTPFVIYPPA